jgi:hypothetical protein
MKTIELYMCGKCEKMIPPSPHPTGDIALAAEQL